MHENAMSWVIFGQSPLSLSLRNGVFGTLLQHAIRDPDPYFQVHDRWLIRQLAPDIAKIDMPKNQDDKRLVLVELAGRNHLNGSRDATVGDFRAAIKTSLQGLLPHSDDLLNELRHDGLLVTTAAGVRFRHLSFQEYLAAEFLQGGDQSGQRAKPILRKFYGGDDWWHDVLGFYVTRTSNPTVMEEWLIKQAVSAARSLNSAYVQSLELDKRLNFLRKALRETFPSYTSRYPEGGIISESIQRGTQIITQKKTLVGVRIE